MILGQFRLALEGTQISIPAPIRPLFLDGAYITRGLEQNLLIMSSRVFMEFCSQVAGQNLTDPNSRLLNRLINGNASKIEISPSGKVMIPPDLAAVAGLQEEIVLVGQGNYCEVWSASHWDEQTDLLLDTAANAGRFAHLDLTMP